MTTAAEVTTALSFAPFQLEMTATRIPNRADSVPNDWSRTASHWNLSITRKGCGVKPTITTEYSMGSAHKGAPNLADVMYSLHLDSRGVEGTTFESWAGDYSVRYRTSNGLQDTCVVASDCPANAMRSFNWAEGRNCAISAIKMPTHADDVALLADLGITL